MLSARQELYLHSGLLNGSVANSMLVGGSTHAILVGSHGSGLTNTARHFVSQLCTEYEENSIAIDIIDCDNEDFAVLKSAEAYRRCIDSIVCSTRIDVLVNALKSVESKLKYVLERIANKGFTGYNEFVEKSDITVCFVPARRVVFISGFNKLFDPDSYKYLEACQLMRNILMLGGATGVHVVATSTYISKEIPTDILEKFGVRFVLRCDRASEKTLLGSTSTLNFSRAYGEIAVKCGETNFVDVAAKCTEIDFLHAVTL